jgi:PST family polysaccharide transporter
MATVQKDVLTHFQVSNLFWVATGLGLGVALLIIAASPLVAWFYDEPRLKPITLALAAAPFFSGLTIQHQALLRRNMRQREIATVQVSSQCLAYVLGIALAWHYRSYWALVALPIAASALRMAGTWLACAWRPGLPRRGTGVREMIGFGANLTGFSFVNYFARSGDNLLIGWAWGETALGMYERAYKLMMAPVHQINGPLAGVMIPALSRLNAEPTSYRAAYLRCITVLQFISCPLLALVAVMAPTVVQVVLGPGFADAAPILRWLAIAGFLQPLVNTLGWLYISQGRSRDLMKWGLVSSALIVASFVIGISWGPLGVARAYALMIGIVIAPFAIWFAGSKGAVSRVDLARECAYALAVAAPTVMASSFVAYELSSEPASTRLMLAAIASGVSTAPLLIFTRRGREIFTQIKEIASHVHTGRSGK